MFFYLERLQKQIQELKKNIYSNKYQVHNFKFRKGDFLDYQSAHTNESEFQLYTDQIRINNQSRYWFEKDIELPQSFQDTKIIFEVVTGKENGWDAINPQFLAYLNQKSIQGLDMNHTTILLDPKEVGSRFTLSLHAYTGMQKDDISLTFYISKLHQEVQDIYFDLLVLYETLQVLEKESIEYHTILNACNKAVETLDFRDHNRLIISSKRASKILSEFIHNNQQKNNPTVSLIGHTHIDIAWLWPLKQTREKAVRSFSTVVSLMEKYPHYQFMSSQPQLYQFVKEDNKELYERIKHYVKEGRWEVEGGMWLEADCNIPSGESLIRHLQKGKKFFKEEFDVDSKILWLPDVFGYSAALPQILKKIGMNYFMTTKISWNEYNKMPYDTFVWKGIDGTEILSYFVTTNEYEKVRNNDHRTIYEGTINPSQIKGTYHRYQQKNINNDVMMLYGYGDGGGGPTYEMLEVSKRLQKGIPGLPNVRESNATKFFDKLNHTLKNQKNVPNWSGELYLEYHRGTYTTSSKSKKYNRFSERLVHDLEVLSVIMSTPNTVSIIDEAIDIILLNQFHDIIPGTSVKEVYEESFIQYQSIISKLTNQIDAVLNQVEPSKSSVNTITVLNTTSFEREDVILFDNLNKFTSLMLNNKYYPIQQLSDNRGIAYVTDVKPLGYTTYEMSSFEIQTTEYSQSPTKLENHYLRIYLDKQGYITSIIDKEENRELIQQDMQANQFVAYEDIPHNWDAWDINVYYKEKSYKIEELLSSTIIETGQVRTILRQVRKYNESIITQDIILYQNSKRVDFETNIDWQEKHTLLRVLFPVTIMNPYARYEIQYGNVLRTTHHNTSWDQAMFEVPAQKWADLSEGNYGISLLNDCKYGYSIKDSILALSLLKSSQFPCEDIDKGNHQFVYSFYPHQGDYSKGETIKEAYKLNYPLYILNNLKPNINNSILAVSHSNIIVEVLKYNENQKSIFVRAYESTQSLTTSTFTFHKSIISGIECNLLGDTVQELLIGHNTFVSTFKPFEIKTFHIELGK